MKKIIELILIVFLVSSCTKNIHDFQYVNKNDICGYYEYEKDTIKLDTVNLIIDKHNEVFFEFHYLNNIYPNYKFSIVNEDNTILMLLYYNNKLLNKEYFKIN